MASKMHAGSVLLCVLGLLCAASAARDLVGQQRQALVDLHTSTNGPHWSRKIWPAGLIGSPCDWEGVTCNSARNWVTKLSLERNNLTGSLPDSWGALKLLGIVDLHNNKLSGPIPPSFAEMDSIFHLDMSMNNFEGTIPASFVDLATHRVELNLGHNQHPTTHKFHFDCPYPEFLKQPVPEDPATHRDRAYREMEKTFKKEEKGLLNAAKKRHKLMKTVKKAKQKKDANATEEEEQVDVEMPAPPDVAAKMMGHALKMPVKMENYSFAEFWGAPKECGYKDADETPLEAEHVAGGAGAEESSAASEEEEEEVDPDSLIAKSNSTRTRRTRRGRERSSSRESSRGRERGREGRERGRERRGRERSQRGKRRKRYDSSLLEDDTAALKGVDKLRALKDQQHMEESIVPEEENGFFEDQDAEWGDHSEL